MRFCFCRKGSNIIQYTATREEAELIKVIFGFSWFLNYDDHSLQELELPRLSNEEVTEAVERAIRNIDVVVERVNPA